MLSKMQCPRFAIYFGFSFLPCTSAACQKDAERARYKVQVPNIASKAFLSLKSLALKANLKVRLEISDLGRLPPIL